MMTFAVTTVIAPPPSTLPSMLTQVALGLANALRERRRAKRKKGKLHRV